MLLQVLKEAHGVTADQLRIYAHYQVDHALQYFVLQVSIGSCCICAASLALTLLVMHLGLAVLWISVLHAGE